VANPFRAAADISDREFNSGPSPAFGGASTSRLFWDWAVGILSPDRELQYNARLLRARARDLRRNNPWVAGWARELVNNIIGDEGIQLHAQIKDDGGTLDKETNRALEAAWKEWDFPENASVDGHDSWVDLQRLAVEGLAIDGEIFVRHHPGFLPSRHRYAVQLIDPDLLDEFYNVAPDENGVEVRMGVELDRNGRAIGYWFWRNHPADLWPRRERVRIDAKEITHLFVRYRPGQTRGVSWLAPILTNVHHLDGLTESELVASRMTAAKMGFIENVTPEAIEAYAAKLRSGKSQPQDLEVAPGLIDELAPGQTFKGFDPQHPNSAFEAFNKIILRGIGRGLGSSYSALTGDLSDANYGSQRAGLLPERDNYRVIQGWLKKWLHRTVYRNWVGMALLARAIDLPFAASRLPSDYFAVAFRERGWKWIDPLKDLQAADLEVKLGLTSRTRLASERGVDFEEIVDEIAAEQEYAREKGVYIGGAAAKPAGGEAPPGDEPVKDDVNPTQRGLLRASA
jgi:lambda family phage portal protein